MAELSRMRGEGIEGKPRPLPPLGTPGAGGGEPAELSPVDALTVEHNLIRRVMRAMEGVVAQITEDGVIDPYTLLRIADFVQTYAHRVHHGKEEEILFRELHGKDLEPAHRRTMEELAHEHVEMRSLVGDLTEALEAYPGGEEERVRAIREALSGLTDRYPSHLEREEVDFFPAVKGYLDEDDMEAVLEEMAGHDRALIHEKYGSLADGLAAVAEDWVLRE